MRSKVTYLVFLFFILLTFLQPAAQTYRGVLRGKAMDGLTRKTLFGVSVSIDSVSKTTSTSADGSYHLMFGEGVYSVTFRFKGYQGKLITNVTLHNSQITYLDIFLYPISKSVTRQSNKHFSNDSLRNGDSILRTSFNKETRSGIYNVKEYSNGLLDIISSGRIEPGNDKNAAALLKRLNGVIVQDIPASSNIQSLNVFGLGERYNQVILNGSVVNSFEQLSRSYPLDILPAEALDQGSVQKIANSSIPADFAGGNVEIKTKDFPDQDFFYVQGGAGFSDATNGKDFFGDTRNKGQLWSFPGPIRNLPAEFPTTRSPSSFKAKNPQEQVDLSKLLRNNLGAVNYGRSKPSDKILLGFGRIIKLPGEKKIGIISFLSQSKSEFIEETTVQVAPDVTSNPFPFTDISKVLIRSQSKDISYQYASNLGGTVNASLLYGRNKISLKNFVSSQFTNTCVQRSLIYKPDEDSLAHAGINYITSRRVFLNTQLSGEHALGGNGNFKLTWQASYTYYRQQNPDERNFLLRQDSADENKYQIAVPGAAPFNPPQFSNPNVYDPNLTNTGRLWRSLTDNNFEGWVSISDPFNLFNRSQVISGGIYIQTRNRVFHSDLLPTKGPGYYTLESLLAPERYYPGGLTVTNYFSNFGGSYSYVYPNNRGNYIASANLGASYIRLENQLNDFLSIDWGARVESGTQLVSNSEYNYVAGFKNPRIIALDKNTFVSKIDFLPSLQIRYRLLCNLQLHAGYFKTVNRPQLQELTSYRYYDAIAFLVKIGNPILQSTAIHNYDAGISWTRNAGTSLSVSGFYKKIEQPLEYILSSYTAASLLGQPHNTPPASIIGLEGTFKWRLDHVADVPWLSDFSFFANGIWLKSKVDAGPVRNLENPTPEHSLTGSPDYTINGGLVIQHSRFPEMTILYSRTGDYISSLGSGRIYTLTNGNTVAAIPDYRVKGREQLDIQLSQKIFRSKVQIIAGVNNLLDNPYIEYQDLNGNKKFDTPLSLKTLNGRGGFYQSGTDNTILYIQSQRTYYLTVSYLFK
jgi:TonB-dependent Receptor Plug Domain